MSWYLYLIDNEVETVRAVVMDISTKPWQLPLSSSRRQNGISESHISHCKFRHINKRKKKTNVVLPMHRIEAEEARASQYYPFTRLKRKGKKKCNLIWVIFITRRFRLTGQRKFFMTRKPESKKKDIINIQYVEVRLYKDPTLKIFERVDSIGIKG